MRPRVGSRFRHINYLQMIMYTMFSYGSESVLDLLNSRRVAAANPSEIECSATVVYELQDAAMTL